MKMDTFLCIISVVFGLILIRLGVFLLEMMPMVDHWFKAMSSKAHDNLAEVNAQISDMDLKIDEMEDLIEAADEFAGKLNNVIDRM
ncbi:MAG: hypothetical protein ACSW8B_05655 [bacterium]